MCTSWVGGFVRAACVTAFIALPVLASAQDATITGTVTDTTGGVLPGVTVTVVNEASGISFESVTDERGVFRMPARIGNYRVTATLTGFTDVARDRAAGRCRPGRDDQPADGAVRTSGIGHGDRRGAAARRQQLEPRHQHHRRPRWRNCRSTAGTGRTSGCWRSETASTGSAPTKSRPKEAGTYQVNVDGQQVTYWGGGLGNVQPRFSRDAIAEFEFIANRFDATQGRSQGIQINAVTKGGTNNYLGTFGGYFRDDSLNAADKIVNRVLPVLESAAQHDAWRPDSAGQVSLLRQLRVRARAMDYGVHDALLRVQPGIHGAAKRAQVGPAARLSVQPEPESDGSRIDVAERPDVSTRRSRQPAPTTPRSSSRRIATATRSSSR